MSNAVYDLFESFDGDPEDNWAVYMVRGRGELENEARGRVARVTAGAKVGDEVGKACLVHEFPRPFGVGDTLDIAASFNIPALSGGRISLIDIECKYCGVPTQPGIRLFVDPGRDLFLERGKLGLAQSFIQQRRPLVPVDRWFDVHWRVLFGKGEDGECHVWIDGKNVLSARGANFPDQQVADRFGITLTAMQYDRVQVGLTANSQPREVSIMMDDIELVGTFARGTSGVR